MKSRPTPGIILCLLLMYIFVSMPTTALPRTQTASNPDSVKHMTIDWVLEQVLMNNPRIKAAEQRWFGVEQREEQVSSLDDPMVSYNRWLSTPETRVGPQESVIMLSQRIPFFGKLSLKGEMAVQEAVATQQQYLSTKRDVIDKAKTAFYDLYWIDGSFGILDEYQNVLRSFWRVAESKYRTGVGIQVNVLKAELEISMIEERKLTFEQMRDGTAARLNALLNRDPQAPLASAEALDTVWYNVDADEILRAAQQRQELQGVQAMIKRSETAISLARRNYLPDFQIVGSYVTIPAGRTPALDDGKNPYSIQIGITVPLWFSKLNAAVEEERAYEQALHLTYRDLNNHIAAEVMDILARLRTAQQTVSLYDRQLIPDAERTLASALASYQTGTLDFLSLLDSERMLLNLRLSRVKELANYWKQVAALERAVGGRLP